MTKQLGGKWQQMLEKQVKQLGTATYSTVQQPRMAN
jgi:hypothetical protein